MKTSTSTARGRLATSPALGWSSCRGVRRAPKPQEKGSPAEPRAIPAVSSSSCKRRRERGLCVWSASTSSGNISKSEGLDEKKSFIKSKMLQKNGDCSWAWDDHYLEKVRPPPPPLFFPSAFFFFSSLKDLTFLFLTFFSVFFSCRTTCG